MIAPTAPSKLVPATVILGSFDGAYRPRRYRGGCFAWGWQLQLPGHPLRGRQSRPLARGDSSHSAEMEALLGLLDAYLAHPGPPRSQLVIQGDSQVLCDQVTGTVGCHDTWCAYLLAQIHQRLWQIECAGWPVVLVWIPRRLNQAAHALAHSRAQRRPRGQRPGA